MSETSPTTIQADSKPKMRRHGVLTGTLKIKSSQACPSCGEHDVEFVNGVSTCASCGEVRPHGMEDDS